MQKVQFAKADGSNFLFWCQKPFMMNYELQFGQHTGSVASNVATL